MPHRHLVIGIALTSALLTGTGLATATPLTPAAPHGRTTTAAPLPTAPEGARTLGQGIRAGVVRIASLYGPTPGQCLDADANAGGNGTKVQVWKCNLSAQQAWISWESGALESTRFRGMCLDADTNGAGRNGTKAQLWECNGSSQQQWYTFAGDLAVYNGRFFNNGNTVLDRDNNVPGDGAWAQLWEKNFQSQQWWRVDAV
ncbi:RICIN domain-containing protein [Streptomyces albireticuli]|nr:ricin-type beta-trefoil lectin domain protein [Streptomyces albireticuli]MCD9145014.1 ricin-type beta-trefoil lectin domain protein [Streptomyces albireticuli]MCD9164440.1 ricin-type beta-trefoil lectin domain protein [Streptomyces albireticuli]MCD9194151.1 ricin-type beta-trefoil lectin domain protein [Streptomyces albireticuli]